MSVFGDELVRDAERIVQRWHDTWRGFPGKYPGVSEAALKDHLGAQLRLIGREISRLPDAEAPADLWKRAERLEPEKRVAQHFEIEEVVLEYGLAVDVVRAWIEERSIDVSFEEYSYFFQAMFELTAESVRRYAEHLAELTQRDRAGYLAGVMHQLRTPLSTVSMAAELLARGESDPEPLMARLGRGVRRLKVLVDGVLRLERYRPEELPVRPRALRAEELVREMLADYAHDGEHKGVRLEVHVPATLELRLDADLMTDALGNLVHNAIKYTHEGAVTVDVREEGELVRIDVRDTGPGISQEQLATLFQSAQPGGGGGAGIGLLIACRAARAMGGSIEVESEPGRGSVFRQRLPRAVPPREPKGPREDEG